MLSYIIRRLLLMIPTVFVISVISFVVIELPPGDYVTSYVMRLEQEGRNVTDEMVENIRHRYGLDRPVYVRYFLWASKFIRGDLGFSWQWGKPVSEMLLSRLVLTILVTLSSLLFCWVVAFPIAIYSSVRQYSLGDYFWTFVGFIGLSIPNFLFALVLMFFSYKYFHTEIGGLFSQQFEQAAWSWSKFVDLLQHLWIPTVVIGTAGTAGLIRILRANLLDELQKPYVEMARAKGLSELRLIFKYPLRIAVNPFISGIGWILPSLVSGAVITAVVLDLPTAGPIFLEALLNQDMALAGAFVMLMGTLTVVGVMISDIILAIVDPRIRYT